MNQSVGRFPSRSDTKRGFAIVLSRLSRRDMSHKGSCVLLRCLLIRAANCSSALPIGRIRSFRDHGNFPAC